MYTILSTNRIGMSEERKSAKIRFIHGVPANLPVDIYIDGYLLIAELIFRSTTDFFNITAGTINVEIKISGTDNILIKTSISIITSKKYTLIIYGKESTFNILALEDINTCPPLEMSKIRIAHIAADTPPIDVYINNTSLLFGNIAYGGLGNPTYLDIQSGKYKLNIVPTKTNQSELDINVSFNSGDVYTIIISGISGNNQFPPGPIIIKDSGLCLVYSQGLTLNDR